jgi:CarD family transcriptional regulator, regulator of rRNA transcription
MSQTKIRTSGARPARTGFSEPQQAARLQPMTTDMASTEAPVAVEPRKKVAPTARPEAPPKPSAPPAAEPSQAVAPEGKPAAQSEDRTHPAPRRDLGESEPETPRDTFAQAAPALAAPQETDEESDDSETERAGAVIPFKRPGEAEPPIPHAGGDEPPEHFLEGDHVVYPTHGVGKVERIAVEEIAGHKLELIHITFEENRMTLRVPVTKARSAGLRKLATRTLFDEALGVLKGRARIKRTMWSRRAQEYEAKINSGDPLAIAEVVRDLHRNAGQPDQSFSERQIYEAAMDRLAAELAALDSTDKPTAVAKLADFLKTSPPELAKVPEEYSSDG